MDTFTLEKNAASHKAQLDNMIWDYNNNLTRISKSLVELNTMTELQETLVQAHDYLETLIKEESVAFVKKVRDILDYGIKTIFFDEEYSIEIRNNEDKTSIHLVYTDVDGNTISPDIKDCGGGIRTVVGIMLQLYFIFYGNVEPIIFIDEGFTQVSSIYMPYLMGLIQEMSEKNGLKILLITHDTRIVSYADKVYEIVDGKAILKKSKTGGS